jgi:EH domain-containing protein 1
MLVHLFQEASFRSRTHVLTIFSLRFIHSDLPTVFRTIMKKYDLAPGDFPEIASFSNKLHETKFAEFNTLSEKQIADLDRVLNEDIPKLMEELPSEKDSPDIIRSKMGAAGGIAKVPVPVANNKFGKKETAHESNPFGYDEENEDYWYVSQPRNGTRFAYLQV